MLSRFLTAGALLILCGQSYGQPDIYVDADANGANDGSSWTDAYTDLQEALDYAAMGSLDIEIWVAEGTYIRSGGAADDGFEVYRTSAGGPASVTIYGGFDGTESTLAGRAGLFDTTVLSGDRGTTGVTTDNSLIVITSVQTTVTTPFPGTEGGPDLTIDGLTIEEGRDGAVRAPRGSLSECILRVKNCTLQNNYGTAVSFTRGSVTNSVFENNSSTNGGAVSVGGTTGVSLNTCLFIGNQVTGDGGAVYIAHTFGDTRIFGCVFYDNEAGDDGGAIFSRSPQNTFEFVTNDPLRYEFRLAGCTFVRNVAANDGGAIYREGSGGFPAELGFVANSIFWENEATFGTGDSFGGDVPDIVEYTTDDSGTSGTGNITSDPLFYDEAGGDFRLRPASPARDAGLARVWDEDPYDFDFDSNTSELIFTDGADLDEDGILLEPVPLDNDLGRAREINSNMDMGAFECCPSDSNLDGMSTAADYNAWIIAYNAGTLSIADVNRDGSLTAADSNAWIAAYNAGCN